MFGATGMLGHKVCQGLAKAGNQVYGVVRAKSTLACEIYPDVFGKVKILEVKDVLNEGELSALLKETSADWVINCIGVVKQSSQSENRLISVGINAYFPHLLSRVAHEHNAKLIHISTDCVFSGKVGGYTESSKPDPVDLYGLTKYLGETGLDEENSVTIRTSIIGRELTLPSHGLIEWFISQAGKSIQGYSNALYSGLTTIELSKVIAKLIESFPQGLLGAHHVTSNTINKYDLLCLVNEKLKTGITINKNDDVIMKRDMKMSSFTNLTGYMAPSWPSMMNELCSDPTPYDEYHREKV